MPARPKDAPPKPLPPLVTYPLRVAPIKGESEGPVNLVFASGMTSGLRRGGIACKGNHARSTPHRRR